LGLVKSVVLWGSEMPSELSEQMALCRQLTLAGLCFCAVPNGGLRDKRTAKMLSLSGVRAGVPDLLIFDPPPGGGYVGTAIELKRIKGGRPTARQKRWLEELQKRGWLTFVAHGSRAALVRLRQEGYRV
jgi:hypothetical protein